MTPRRASPLRLALEVRGSLDNRVRVCMWCMCDRVVVEAQDPPTLAIHIASSDDRARTFLVMALLHSRYPLAIAHSRGMV